MADLPRILTSNSAYTTALTCLRKRYWAYESPNGTDGARGWERDRLSLPLSTGGWCHQLAQGLLLLASGGDLSDWLSKMGLSPQLECNDASSVVLTCVAGYQAEARERGLDLGLEMNGAETEVMVQRTIQEQSALLEAFGWAYQRVRVPKLLEEYEILSTEQEEISLLSGDVGLQGRCDAVLRRKTDQRVFVYNLKTSGNPDKRWHDQFEVDSQLMTETLAVERRLGERVYGVVVDGFDKGMRVKLDFQTLKERPKDGSLAWEGQRSRLIYGYKCEDIPGRPTLYDYEGTTRKGWGKFAVWEESFECSKQVESWGRSPVSYWINWLPLEQVEGAFVTLPPILREDRKVESMVRQIVAVEQQIRARRDMMEPNPQAHPQFFDDQLDRFWPQSLRACIYPSRCPFFEMCHGSATDSPESNGFRPRVSNHPLLEGAE